MQALPHARQFCAVGARGHRTSVTPTSSSTRRPSATRCSSSSTPVRRSSTSRTRRRRRPRPRAGPARPSSPGSRSCSRRASAAFELWTGRARAGRRHEGRPRLAGVTLELTTAGESHGPALVAILTGLPAGLRLDRDAIAARPRAPPAGLRPQPAAEARGGRGRGPRRPPSRHDARHAARARRSQPRPRELGVGDEPVAARGRAGAARARSRSRSRGRATPTSPASLKFGHDDVRNALERASARQTAVHVAAGAVAKALLAEIGVDGRGSRRRDRRRRHARQGGRRRPTLRAPTATRSAGSSRSSRTACRRGSARTRRRPIVSTRASQRRSWASRR